MKKPEYVAGVTSMYRKYVDLYLRNGRDHFSVSDQDREMLMDLYNRGNSIPATISVRTDGICLHWIVPTMPVLLLSE